MVKFGGLEITAQTPLRQAVLAARSPVEVEVVREGSPEPLKLQVSLAGSPTRLGVSWRDDPAETASVILTQVVPGSAAHQAGLIERDRVYEVGGQSFAGTKQFRELAISAKSPVEVLVERSGRLFRLQLTAVELPGQ
jgi:S1-C subfamily serine protease